MMPRFGTSLLAATTVSLALASVAQGSFVGTATDPAGDAVDPSPGRDITAVAMSHDRRSGELIGAVQYRGEPGEAQAVLELFAATRSATGCNGLPATGFRSLNDEHDAVWIRLDDADGSGPSGNADKLGYGKAVQQFEASDSRLAGHRLDCFGAFLSEPGNPDNVYDTVGPIELLAQPALSLRVRGAGRQFKANRPRTLKITLANTGDAATGPVRLRLRRVRGLRAKPATTSVSALAPGSRKTVTVKVTLTGRARAATKLKITASAGGLVARVQPTLYIRKPSKPGGGGRSQLCNRWVPDITGQTGGSLILVPCSP